MQFIKSLSGHIASFVKDTISDPFKLILLLVCTGIFIFTAYIQPQFEVKQEPVKEYVSTTNNKVATLYHSITCPYCKKSLKFINSTLKNEFPNVKFRDFELSSPDFTPKEQEKLQEIAKKYGFEAIPVFYIDGNPPIIGFDSEKTPEAYRALIRKSFYKEIVSEDTNKQVDETVKSEDDDEKRYVDIPFMGRIDVFQYSVPFLAVVLGTLDGFNPCAMWVLVFMISIIIEMQDKRKMWLIVGSFLIASAVLYYAVMAGWINLFLLFGYMRNITILIGAVALYTAGLSFKSFYEGHVVCAADNFEERSRISKKIQHLAESPVTWASVAGVIGLAFVVNSIEFLCSAALPAIFTNVLAISVESTFLHYWYIFLYVLFFMIDDIIIFTLAALAVERFVGDKYVKWCKLLGGIILLGLGVAMVFFPDLLTS